MGKLNKFKGTSGRIKACANILSNQDNDETWDLKQNLFKICEMKYTIYIAKWYMNLMDEIKDRDNITILELDEKYEEISEANE